MAEPFRLETERLGALPLLQHFLDRLGIDRFLARRLPPGDASVQLAPAAVLGLLLRSLCLQHEPIYALADWAAPYAPRLTGLAQPGLLNDDRVGRALEQLFDADRAALLTEVVVAMIPAFLLNCDQLHNDSTTITFSGAYADADGQPRGGKPTPVITRGHNKDHRPDLKQLLWILTVTADGAVPLVHRTAPGNTPDDPTHIPTWDALVQLLGRSDFLYVADSKLCCAEAMHHIDAGGGRFLTVLPRTRREDAEFRTWIATHAPDWTQVDRQPGRRRGDPDHVWTAFPWPSPCADGYRLCWFRSSQKALFDAERRAERLHRAQAELTDLAARLAGPRTRFRDRPAVEAAVQAILEKTETTGRITYTVATRDEESFRQEKRGRPGAQTRYRRVVRSRHELSFAVDADAVRAEAASDGCFPLITNDRTLTPAQLLAAYKYQPQLEQRHAELKGPMEVAPVYLQNAARIEALFCLEFLALLVRALIEREIRLAMQRRGIKEISLYPEERGSAAPTATRVLGIFTDVCRHRLFQDDRLVQVFPPQLTPLQAQVLELLGIPSSAYTAPD